MSLIPHLSYIPMHSSHPLSLQRNKTYQNAYYKECIKQKGSNVLICPNSKDLPYESLNGQNVPELNRKLNLLKKKLGKNKKDKTKRKQRKRKKKKKQIKRKRKKKKEKVT